MNCQNVKEYLDRYLDGELQHELAVELKQHTLSCPLCGLELEKEQKFNAMIRNHLHQKEAPYELREAVINRLNRPSKFQFIFGYNWMRPAPLTALATLSMVIAFLGVVSIFNRPFPVFAESVERHMDFLKGSYPMEIQTEDMNEAVAWFEGKMDFAVAPPHVFLEDIKLVGARIVHLKDKKVAYFIFKKDGHFISAYSMDLKDVKIPKVDKSYMVEKPNSTIMISNHKGYKSVVCLHKRDRTGCVWVVDMPEKELKQIFHISLRSSSAWVIKFT